MEWTALTIILSVLFVILQNFIYIIMIRTEKKPFTAALIAVLLILYALMLFFFMTRGATKQQTLLVILMSLPCAFIKPRGADKK